MNKQEKKLLTIRGLIRNAKRARALLSIPEIVSCLIEGLEGQSPIVAQRMVIQVGPPADGIAYSPMEMMKKDAEIRKEKADREWGKSIGLGINENE